MGEALLKLNILTKEWVSHPSPLKQPNEFLAGTPITFAQSGNICSTIWSLYRTSDIIIYRLLYTRLRAGQDWTSRSEKTTQVGHTSLPHCRNQLTMPARYSQTSLVYVCQQCQTHHVQNMGKATLKDQGNKSNIRFGLASGPPCGMTCEQCDGRFSVCRPVFPWKRNT